MRRSTVIPAHPLRVPTPAGWPAAPARSNQAHGQEDDCDLIDIYGHTGPCGGLNRCPSEPTNVCSPAAPLYVCNTDFLCQVAAPGQAGAESLAQCNATCHPPPAQPAPL